ncbi:protein MpCPT6 [Marchantia polymorpha subsp. ruderalis]|uniref:ER-bound oxygenase mpaB/mpaB'/Rubber oxygenase catalytic domain-containing protein n=1 Tax=Marchantia polymorpha TaxID=3197 RepID=A0A2R6XB74_MARPO|nr:hypothetical protein MARPO_0025s0048 [Marchantia polymorpha]BBN03781.1 hypothetical protein Mp_2g26360 [Marchantia polymorpha subsp. ruderalis]|eukprot:PTQ43354.1 hypothetical protein MARPO_0025s0048 [Marchantia polymorpha]
MLVATTLQLAHGEVAKVLETHSMYKRDPWRRWVRTLTFIQLTVQANSAQRSQIVAWLNRLHANIRLFEFETNVFVLATIAYGLAQSHQALGAFPTGEKDAIVSSVMSMADKLSADDRRKPVPTTFSAVEKFLAPQLSSVHLRSILASMSALLDLAQKPRFSTALRRPWSWAKFLLLRTLARDISLRVLSPPTAGEPPGALLSLARIFQPFWYHFHYSACPRVLTLAGLFETLVGCDPSLNTVVDDVHREIFGAPPVGKFAPSEAHLPQLPNGVAGAAPAADLTNQSFIAAVREHLKCAYLRTRLAGPGKQLPRHLGVIMDGNRRFSRQHGLGSVLEGHRLGARRLLQFMTWSFSVGIDHLTVWALSDDNLKRGHEELDPLFAMMADFTREIVMGDAPLAVIDVRIRVVGDRSILPAALNDAIDAIEEATKGEKKLNLQFALGYGGRREVLRAVKAAVQARAHEDSSTIEEALSRLSPGDVSKHTYSAESGVPPMDAILRTSGEKRLSGFALWESQECELSFVAPNWPGMSQSDFLSCLVDLAERKRRFGA